MSVKAIESMGEQAVSPVIGIVLLAALTVILASTIAIFSFNIADNTQKVHVVAVKVERINDTHIIVKNMGGIDSKNLLFDSVETNGIYGETDTGFYGTFNVSVNNIEVSNFVSKGALNCTSSIGSMQHFYPVPVGSQVDVIANYKDGSRAIIYSVMI